VRDLSHVKWLRLQSVFRNLGHTRAALLNRGIGHTTLARSLREFEVTSSALQWVELAQTARQVCDALLVFHATRRTKLHLLFAEHRCLLVCFVTGDKGLIADHDHRFVRRPRLHDLRFLSGPRTT
jgi:hypothetical protein